MPAIYCEFCGEDLLSCSDSPVKDDSGTIYCSEDCLEKSHGSDLEDIEYTELSVDELISNYN